MSRNSLSWALLAVAMVLFAIAVVFKAFDLHGGWYFLPVAWWVTWGLWNYAQGAFLSGETSGESAWNPIIWPFRLVFFLGFFALALQGTAELIKALQILFRRGEAQSRP